MNSRICATAATVLASVAALLVLLGMLGGAESGAHPAALAAPVAPTVSAVDPSSAPNDLDTSIVITGTAFETDATVTLGSTALDDAGRVSSTTLTATVPWGLDPGVYTLTVENPDGSAASLTDAFTVTEAIGVWNAGEIYGGSVEKIVINPVTPTTLYASSAHVGLFRSRDGGKNWSLQYAGGAMHPVIDPHTPNRIYVHLPWSLYRSDDEGESWTALNPQFPYTDVSESRCTPMRIRPYVHPISDTVYAIACEPDQGVVKSTDHGDTWTSISEGITDTAITALAFHPEDPEAMYVGTGNGHIFSTSNGGITWTYTSKPVGCVGTLAVNPFGSHEVWVASDNSYGDPCVLRASTNEDLTTWTTLTETTEGCSWPGPSIYFDPDISGRVLVADVGFKGLKTTDGGTHWESFTPSNESFVQDLAPHPTQTETVYLGDKWEGVYKTTDGGNTWQVTNQGLTALYPLQMDAHGDQPGMIYARLNDERLYKGIQGGQTWQRLPISRAASVQIDPLTSTQIYAGRSGQPGYVYVSADEGQTWMPSAPLPETEPYCDGWTFPWSLYAVPKQPGTLLVGAQHHCEPLPHPGSLYRTTDYGTHWERVYTYTYHQYEMPIAMAADPTISTTIYAAIPNGEDGLLKSTDSGMTWSRIAKGKKGITYAADIAVEPVSPYRIFVMTYSPHFYVSANHAVTWTEMTSPAPNVAQILSTGGDSSRLYAAGDLKGLLRWEDDKEPPKWTHATGILGQVPVYALATVTDTDRVFLYAGTTGGRVEDTEAQTQGPSALGATAEGKLVNAGIYRYTTRRARKVYLPLVLRSYASQ